MNPGYVSAFAALAGSLIGGLTTFAAAWITQRRQANVQWLLQEKTRRQELYQQLIEEASKFSGRMNPSARSQTHLALSLRQEGSSRLLLHEALSFSGRRLS